MKKTIFLFLFSIILFSMNNISNNTNEFYAPPISPTIVTDSVLQLSASSTLSDTVTEDEVMNQPKLRYGPYNVMDSDPLTTWAEGQNDAGPGVTLDFRFSKSITFDEIRIMPGYFDPKYWSANNRLKNIQIQTGGDSKPVIANFGDKMSEGNIPFSQDVESNHLVFTIKDVYPGEKWQDTCISEISFYLDKKKLEFILPPLIRFDSGSKTYSFDFKKDQDAIPVYFDNHVAFLHSDGTFEGNTTEIGLMYSTLRGDWSFDKTRRKISLGFVYHKAISYSMFGSEYEEIGIELELTLLSLGCEEHFHPKDGYLFFNGPYYFTVSNFPYWGQDDK